MTTACPNETALAALTAGVSALRLQVEFLTRRLTGTLPGPEAGRTTARPGHDIDLWCLSDRAPGRDTESANGAGQAAGGSAIMAVPISRKPILA